MLRRLRFCSSVNSVNSVRSTKPVGVPLCLRLYSDDSKYKNIDNFNQNKTQYNFNHTFKNDLDIHQSRTQDDDMININELIENDPRLAKHLPDSAEYQEELARIHREYKQRDKEENRRYETQQRLQAIGLGLLAIMGAISAHHIFFNYEYYKNWVMKSSYGIDEMAINNKIKKSNSKSTNYLADRLMASVDDEFVADVLDSEKALGLYIFGGLNGSKLPARMKFFNDMLLRDVKIDNNLLVVVSDDGKVYQYIHSKNSNPQLIKLPFKVDKCEISKESIYLLTTKGEINYIPRIDRSPSSSSSSSSPFSGIKTRNWIGKSVERNFNVLSIPEKIQDMALGDNHLLLLTNQGKVFNAKVCSGKNYGQFGLPSQSPYNDNVPSLPLNEAFEMTMLNNEMVIDNSGTRTIRPRIFTSIASGKFHNLASDSKGNVWSWGQNSYGQCGFDVSYTNDIQPVPKMAFSKSDLLYHCNQVIKPEDGLIITKLYANNESSILQLYSPGAAKSVVLSLGNGIKGQLGINRFMHVASRPQIIKSIIDLGEYNEDLNKTVPITIKSISTGNNHSFIQLNNFGKFKDVLSFGDNELGQFGNGKLVRNGKPSELPKLIQPEDVAHYDTNNKLESLKPIAKLINNLSKQRLQMIETKIKGVEVEQVIEAVGDSSVIYYKRK